MRTAVLALILAAGCGGGGTSDARVPASDPPSAEVAAMEARVHDLVNAERANQGVAPLVHDELLRQIARAHSEDMVARNFFSHVNPDGLDPFDRLAMESVTYFAAAENIAWNRGYADPGAVAVDGWMNSDGHRANILNATYTHAGLGAARDDSDGAWFFTQVFVLPTGSLVAVAFVVEEQTQAPDGRAVTSSWSLAPR